MDFWSSASRKRCWKEEYSTFKEFQTAVKDYIDYYNNKRIQEKTKWMSPDSGYISHALDFFCAKK